MINNKKVIIWGCSGHAKVLVNSLKKTKTDVIAFFDKNPEIKTIIKDIPVYIGEQGFIQWTKKNKASNIYGLVAIGGSHGTERLAIQQLFMEYGIIPDTLIDINSSVCPSVKIGAGSQILAHSLIATDTVIGEGCIINHNTNIDHECEIGNGVHIAPSATLCGCVKVGNNVMVGAGAVILPRIKIEDNSIIGAGSVVTKNVSENQIVVGNPAKLLKNRTPSH